MPIEAFNLESAARRPRPGMVSGGRGAFAGAVSRKTFLAEGFHLIDDKPPTLMLKQSVEIVNIARKSGLIFGLAQNNTGYPLVHPASQMLKDGALGDIHVVSASYIQISIDLG